MQDFLMDGVSKIAGGEFAKFTADGVGTCTGEIKAESIKIDGVFHCDGKVETGSLCCDGVAEFKANVIAKKVHIDGVVSVKNGANMEGNEITCDGLIEVSGEVSADIIHVDGYINAAEIVGDKITICSRSKNAVANFFVRKHSKVQLIEATTVELTGVKSKTVNGRDVVIGPHCKIENLDCCGTLFIHPTSAVAHITGNYTKMDEINAK